MSLDALQLFFSSATQYYVSGGFAVFAGLSPLAGNLLHHAVEMYIEGVLSKTLTMTELKKLSHNLPVVWEAFKAQVGDASLRGSDALVSSLHKFEELRYPDSVLSSGMMVTISVSRDSASGIGAPARPEPTYKLYLEEVDALVDKIFQVASLNPAFFLAGVGPRAREYLKIGNAQGWVG